MPTKSKGKARSVSPIAEPTERSPLLTRSTADAESIRSLASSSSSALYTVDTPATGHAHRRTRRFAILISIYSLFLGVAVFVVLFAVSFIPSQIEQDRLHEAFIYHDPKVDILNVAEDGVHISLTLRGGVDVDRALATDGRRGSGWWESLRQSAVHGLLGVLPTQAVYVTLPEVLVCARGGGLPLLNVSLPSDVVVPLTKKSELVEIEIEAVGNPVAPAGELWTWGQDTWANGTIDVVIGIREAQATIPGAWWSKWAVVTQKDLIVPLAMPGKLLRKCSALSERCSHPFSTFIAEQQSAHLIPAIGLSLTDQSLPFRTSPLPVPRWISPNSSPWTITSSRLILTSRLWPRHLFPTLP
jgi:hypothetical protein